MEKNQGDIVLGMFRQYMTMLDTSIPEDTDIPPDAIVTGKHS